MKEEKPKEEIPFTIKNFAAGEILLKNTEGWILLKKAEAIQLRNFLTQLNLGQ